MKCKLLHITDPKNNYFQSLIDTVYLLSGNSNEKNLSFGYQVKSVERLYNKEGGK